MALVATIFFFLFVLSFVAAILCGLWTYNKNLTFKEYGSVDEYRQTVEQNFDMQKTELEKKRGRSNWSWRMQNPS